ncbi:hypothetical protein [Malonomonas rubra]|uniref:hypothetical protein n=1 Tax=Malonomonas rubra TaxID=57040 RepID=UPI0026F22FCB|nr:hypothetical protein [Malonomonas rubra]
MPDSPRPPITISPLFVNRFRVDEAAPFKRHLNRLEVEIAREDYSGLKRVELVSPVPGEDFYAGLKELTERLLHTTQNNYNRQLIERLGIRVYLDVGSYHVYYRLPKLCIRFVPSWREQVLQGFFGCLPQTSTGWQSCSQRPEFRCKFIADEAGGALLLVKQDADPQLPLSATAPMIRTPWKWRSIFYTTARGGRR